MPTSVGHRCLTPREDGLPRASVRLSHQIDALRRRSQAVGVLSAGRDKSRATASSWPVFHGPHSKALTACLKALTRQPRLVSALSQICRNTTRSRVLLRERLKEVSALGGGVASFRQVTAQKSGVGLLSSNLSVSIGPTRTAAGTGALPSHPLYRRLFLVSATISR
jgi:hypothetical protein